MTPILDRFGPKLSAFRPKNTAELFALRLAQKLNDAAAANHYAELMTQYSEAELLTAFRRAVHSGARDLGRSFHGELHRSSGNGGNGHNSQLVSVRIERRAVAVAIFSGYHLSYTQVRQLSSAKDKALASAVGFINWIAAQFRLDSAALELIPAGDEMQRQVLNHAVVNELRDHALPVWELAKHDLFESYGHPSLQSRKELRELVTNIWPVLTGSNGKSFIQDAAALGLHVQIERSFLN
jgi:hypothetical protein